MRERRKRRWTSRPLRPQVWSDAKWGKDPNVPLYYRDGYGREFTKRNGLVLPYDNTEYGNDFRYRPHTNCWDHAHPWPQSIWRHLDD